MMSIWIVGLGQFSVLGFALVGGCFLAFSDFLMRSFARTPGAGGAEAMQVINKEVFRYVFMALFLGLAPVSLALAAYGLGTGVGTGRGAALIGAAGLVYILGCFLVTIVFNVPLNTKLADLDAQSADAQRFWRNIYLPQWTFWNTVRTAACVLAAILSMAGLLQGT